MRRRSPNRRLAEIYILDRLASGAALDLTGRAARLALNRLKERGDIIDGQVTQFGLAELRRFKQKVKPQTQLVLFV